MKTIIEPFRIKVVEPIRLTTREERLILLPGNLQPGYPAQAVFSQLKGKVVVRAQVLANGQVGELFLRQSSGAPVLDQAALATVRGWRFRPATRNGQPVPAWVNVPIEYRNPS